MQRRVRLPVGAFEDSQVDPSVTVARRECHGPNQSLTYYLGVRDSSGSDDRLGGGHFRVVRIEPARLIRVHLGHAEPGIPLPWFSVSEPDIGPGEIQLGSSQRRSIGCFGNLPDVLLEV